MSICLAYSSAGFHNESWVPCVRLGNLIWSKRASVVSIAVCWENKHSAAHLLVWLVPTSDQPPFISSDVLASSFHGTFLYMLFSLLGTYTLVLRFAYETCSQAALPWLMNVGQMNELWNFELYKLVYVMVWLMCFLLLYSELWDEKTLPVFLDYVIQCALLSFWKYIFCK